MFWLGTQDKVEYTFYMDGFNVIPVDIENKIKSAQDSANKRVDLNTGSGNSNFINTLNNNTEPETPPKEEVQKSSFLGTIIFLLGFASFLGVVGYFAFIILSWQNTLSQIGDYSAKLSESKKNIDTNELQNFITLDKSLNAIKQRLSRHILNSEVLKFMNSNLRTSLALTNYSIDVKEQNVEVSFDSVAASLKDMTEQSERLYALKQSGLIKNYSVSGISFESDLKRTRFNTKVVFDRSKVSALALSSNNKI